MTPVAVSMRTATDPQHGELRDAISKDWLDLLLRWGVAPLLIPNHLPDPTVLLEAAGVRHLLLTNGDSLGEPDAPGVRDLTEARLLAHAIEHGMPVLGVCRGLQFINHHFGGELCRDIGRASGETHVAVEHEVRTPEGGRYRCNSFHDQGVMLDGLAGDLIASAWTTGGVVEALAHPELPVRAVQWHPERPGAPRAEVEALFKWWLNA